MSSTPNIQGLMLIGGERVESASGAWLESVDPANEQVIGKFPAGNAEDVANAVAAARRAQPAWAALDIKERARYLHALAGGIRKRAAELLHVEVLDTGNTITPMRGDIENAAAQLEWYSGLALEVKGETIPASSKNLHLTIREPYGVVARIVPFNHPLMFAARGIAGPLITGNTAVIKPPETSSLSASILGELCQEHLPPGTVNIVTGLGSEVGDAIVRHPFVKRIAFTGSVPTGQAIQRSAAEVGVKAISLELGGKNPFVVYDDVDVDAAADAVVAGMNFGWASQSCGSTSRVLAHRKIYDALVSAVAERVARIRLGHQLDPQFTMGPVNSRRQVERITSMIEAAKSEGARVVTGGGRPTGKDFERGFWIQPTVFADVHASMNIAREEVFGPVLCMSAWDDEEEMFGIANGLEYGLAAAVWTRDIKQALTAARRLEAGTIWVNGVGTHFKGSPYGGVKNSGVGRESCMEELLSYTEVKSIQVLL